MIVSDKDEVSIDSRLPSFRVQFSIVVSLLSELLALSTRFMNSSRDECFSCSSAFNWSTVHIGASLDRQLCYDRGVVDTVKHFLSPGKIYVTLCNQICSGLKNGGVGFRGIELKLIETNQQHSALIERSA